MNKLVQMVTAMLLGQDVHNLLTDISKYSRWSTGKHLGPLSFQSQIAVKQLCRYADMQICRHADMLSILNLVAPENHLRIFVIQIRIRASNSPTQVIHTRYVRTYTSVRVHTTTYYCSSNVVTGK